MFVFSAPNLGADTISDFRGADDQLRVSAGDFAVPLAALDADGNGLLDGARFAASRGGKAAGTLGQFCYDTGSGKLYWDADGKDADDVEDRVLLATLSGKPALTASDLTVVA